MFVLPSEQRKRHRFIESSIESAFDVLQKPQVVQRLGRYAAALSGVADRLYLPNVRHGVVSVPKAYRDKDDIPVLALRGRRKVRMSPDFSAFSPRQRSSAIAHVTHWQPTKESPAAFVDKIESAVVNDYPARGLKSGLDRDDLAAVARLSTGIRIRLENFANAPSAPRHMVKSRPFMKLRYTDGQPFFAPAMLHELEHVDQHEREVILPLETPEDEVNAHLAYELEAYHVGALCVLGLRDSGEDTADLGDQVAIDAIRLAENGPDSFAFTDAIDSRLRGAGIWHLTD